MPPEIVRLDWSTQLDRYCHKTEVERILGKVPWRFCSTDVAVQKEANPENDRPSSPT